MSPSRRLADGSSSQGRAQWGRSGSLPRLQPMSAVKRIMVAGVVALTLVSPSTKKA